MQDKILEWVDMLIGLFTSIVTSVTGWINGVFAGQYKDNKMVFVVVGLIGLYFLSKIFRFKIGGR